MSDYDVPIILSVSQLVNYLDQPGAIMLKKGSHLTVAINEHAVLTSKVGEVAE